ncbi:hypothetical protein [Thermococcus sp. M39]|uniref:hypothetical protein n=1 Tax=Thermococcus sp. M39 TaxID=1638262 RepID=UPI00143CB1C2|nr:hypothetical protein [Thermococcus sp. M39]
MKKERDEILRWIRSNSIVSMGLLIVGLGAFAWDRDLAGFGIFMVILGVLYGDGNDED